MQDKFVLRSVKTLKKVAALGTGLAMLGATLTGALAADLKDYPSPFVMDGAYDDANALVAGDNAAAADTLGMVDISTNLQFMAKTPVATGGSTVSVSGPAKSMQVALGKGLSNSTYFDAALQDDDLSHLFDGEITFRGTAYDTSEELQLGNNDQIKPYVATSLMTDDDYKTDVFFETGKDEVRYAYKFDEFLNMSDVSTTYPLEIDFLGMSMKLTSVSDAQFDAYVGETHYMNAGDTVTVEGKNIKLIDVSSSAVSIEVDGVSEIVSSGSPKTVNGIEVTVDTVFSRTARDESSASLVLGVQSSETYKNGDAFVGEDKDDPNWVWNIENMVAASASAYDETPLGAGTATMVPRVENDFSWNDDGDNPAGAGECIVLPNEYLSVCLDSLSVGDDDYAEYVMEIDDSADFSQAFGSSFAEVKAIHLSTSVDEGFELPAYSSSLDNQNETSAVKTKDIWLFVNDASGSSTDGTVVPGNSSTATCSYLDVMYQDTSVSGTAGIKFHGAVKNSTATCGSTTVIAAINFENTKGTDTQGNMKLLKSFQDNASGTAYLNLSWDINADSTSDLTNGLDDLAMKWGLSSNRFNSLGATAATEEASELRWGPTPTDIGSKDEDHRTYYGVVIKDPKGQSSSDKVTLQIPNDQVFANIVIKGKAASVSAGSTSYVPAQVTPRTMLASEVSDPTKYNLIVVGGPCANPLAETLFEVSCDGWAYAEGEALVKLVDNGDKVAMLVAGSTALDTRRAAKAVADYKDYAFSGAEVMVKGTTLSDISVESA